MAKVVLINPAIREEAKPTWVPSGLGYLAWFLEEAGHSCDILDLNALRLSKEETLARLRALDYDLIGLTGLITNYIQLKQFCAILKKMHPDTPIVIGGPVTTCIAHLFIGRTRADIIVEGEGELILVDIADAIDAKRPLSDVKGITYRGDDGKPIFTGPGKILDDLDLLPTMPWNKFEMDIYLHNPCLEGYEFERSLNIVRSRGCPFRCNFCHDGIASRKVRFRSAKKCLEDVKNAYNLFKIEYFRWDDELFVANVKRAEEFCHGMIESGLSEKVKWGATGRVNIVTPPLLKLMHDAGCIDINYGIESGSDRMLKNMNKVTTREMGLRAVKWTKEAGITTLTSFMVGTRDEDPESIGETVSFLKEADLLTPVLFFTTPNPGTELWDYCVKDGEIEDEEKFIIDMCKQGDFNLSPIVNITKMSDTEFIETKRKAEKQILINYLMNNKFRIPKMAYQRYRKLGFRRFMGQCKNAISRLTASTKA